MRDGGRELQKLLVASNRVLRISKGAPTWRTYVEYVNDVVIDGLARAVAESLRALCELVDVVEIARGETLPLLEVQLELAAPDVVFSPELGEAGGPGSIANRVQGWIKSFFKPCSVRRCARARRRLGRPSARSRPEPRAPPSPRLPLLGRARSARLRAFAAAHARSAP